LGKLFGTDGIRGKANRGYITPEFVLRLGQAIGVYFRRHHLRPRVLIGKDTRLSGYMLEQAMSSGIGSVGVETLFLGPIPTPGIAYLTRGLRACAGVVISASHNPYEDNGIKIFDADGYKLPDHVEEELEAILLHSQGFQKYSVFDEKIGLSRRVDDAIGQYAVFLKEQFPRYLSLDNLSIVLDCANGAAYKVAPKVFEELGAKVFLLAASPNGKNINRECGALYPERLRKRVLSCQADLGIGFDGDADRLVVVDDKGALVDGDEILAICGIHWIKSGKLKKNTIVTTVMSNHGLDRSIKEHGGQVRRTKVGDRYVVEEMRRGNYTLGGEQSGHVIFRDKSTTGDGILAALHVLSVMLEKEQKISEIKTCMQKFPQILRSIKVEFKPPLTKMKKLQKQLTECEKKLGEEGRILFRYSGTEDKVRLMVEGSDLSVVKKTADDLSEMIVEETQKLATINPV